MEASQVDQICQAINAGETKYVENLGSHEVGRVRFCSGSRLEVEIGDKWETWGIEYCQEAQNPGST